ncbi:diguanylate cyclase (GGDEF) domain-containing protein [Fontibacillus panacisegetis]|uniref:Diguanylate cyclase (GGDEF) domain-containing protein n=1 Tax=Fontibacillus panacisegetis TaxID=670482 RepID=A0A1G7JAV1_9BACL|nr:diguanylate cyclase [Fontibacillus panacisegetis]SDF22013.1 diguanylate cyclase (GGDEF) domain-containing protein [Fontibacillus panacisegetis]
MGLIVWIDLILFCLLFALFVYIFASVTITKLHKVYLGFHFSMMLWPFSQFAIKTTDNLEYQLFYVKLAFVDLALLSIGWLLFTLFLTGQSQFLRTTKYAALFIPALIAALIVVYNPKSMFVEPINGGYIVRDYGPLFWLIVSILAAYVVISLFVMIMTLASKIKTPRIKRQVRQVLRGMIVMILFIAADIICNVTSPKSFPVVPGLTSLGILVSVIFFVIAIHRDKVLDIVTIAHQDIIDTITLGILVLDENEIVVEINQSLPPYINLHIGERFNIEVVVPQGESISKTRPFLDSYQESPLNPAEIELTYRVYNAIDPFHVKIQVAPIVVSHTMVGRIITFQDITEIRHLIDETHSQNEVLQRRNQSLITIQQELFETNQKLQRMTITDSLTGCYNRSYLTHQLELKVMKHNRAPEPFTILLLDIDFFKSINDTYGHLAGDAVLRSTVEAIQRTLRKNDILARYGGEEFVIYLPNTDQDGANSLAERIKASVESNKIIVQQVESPISITISMGLLFINHITSEDSQNPQAVLNTLFDAVDKALYQAKNEGRNRIVNAQG